MKKRKEKLAVALIALTAIAVTVFAVAIVGSMDGASVATLSLTSKATVKFKVVEGYTEEPIEGASIYVLETKKYYTTDAAGESESITVPVIVDNRFSSSIPKQWGEINLIVYKEGYLPYALFYLQVSPDTPRENVKILMFADDGSMGDQPFSIIEGPNKVWVNALIDKYKP